MLIDGLNFTSPKQSLSDITESEYFNGTIHPEDDMTAGAPKEIYYWMGKTALDSIQAVRGLLESPKDPNRILDFPSGSGRVLRFLRYAWPNAEITACDINRIGVDFCHQTFGAVPVYSSEDLSRVRIDGKFDIIWVGSLFTHLKETSAKDLLNLFDSILADDGLLIFTIAGEFVFDLVLGGDLGGLPEAAVPSMEAAFEQRGFCFGNYEPGIVDESNYGRAFIHQRWLDETIKDYPGFTQIAYITRGYARRQDVVAWIKRGC